MPKRKRSRTKKKKRTRASMVYRGVRSKLPKHEKPRFRANRGRTTVPRRAAFQYQVGHGTSFEAQKQFRHHFKRDDVPTTVGHTVVYKGMDPVRENHRETFISTTTRPWVAMRFAKGLGKYVYKITLAPGTKFLPLPADRRLNFDEHEVLLPPGKIVRTGDVQREKFLIGILPNGQGVKKLVDVVPAIYVPVYTKRGTLHWKGTNSNSGNSWTSLSANLTSASVSQRTGASSVSSNTSSFRKYASNNEYKNYPLHNTNSTNNVNEAAFRKLLEVHGVSIDERPVYEQFMDFVKQQKKLDAVAAHSQPLHANHP